MGESGQRCPRLMTSGECSFVVSAGFCSLFSLINVILVPCVSHTDITSKNFLPKQGGPCMAESLPLCAVMTFFQNLFHVVLGLLAWKPSGGRLPSFASSESVLDLTQAFFRVLIFFPLLPFSCPFSLFYLSAFSRHSFLELSHGRDSVYSPLVHCVVPCDHRWSRSEFVNVKMR